MLASVYKRACAQLLVFLFAALAGAQSFVPISNSAQEMYISANGLSIAANEGTNQQGNGAWLWRTDTQQFWPDQVSNVYVLSGNGLAAGGDADSNSITFYYPFGGSPNQPGIVPQAMSTDGLTVYGYDGAGNPDYIWSPTAGGKVFFQTSSQEYPWTCSGDAGWVYGYTVNNNPDEAWVYTKTGGAKNIGAFHPYQCSLNGQMVVGVSSTNSEVVYTWGPTAGASHLVLPGPTYAAGDMPVSITADGTTVWGSFKDTHGDPHAFVWASGDFTDLGANSAFFAERGQRGSNRFPGYWQDSKGVTHYGFYETGGKGWVDVLAALKTAGHDLTGWSNLEVQAIDDNGIKMCGFGDESSGNQAFYVAFPADVIYLYSFAPLNPSVVGGSNATMDVAMSGKAPTGGLPISLTSNNPNVKVLTTVTVPAGSSSLQFTVATEPVSYAETVTLTAAYNGYATQTQLIVTPTPLESLSVSPTTVYGGEGSVGTVTLAGKAGTTGAVVGLESGSNSVQIPPSVTVPSGDSSDNFNITTTNVTSSVSVLITASVGTISKTATLTVTPNPLRYFFASPSYVVGGNGTTGYIEVSTAAGQSGDTIQLSSANISVTVPPSVNILAGQTVGTFSISTSSVTSNTTVQLTATFGTFTAHTTVSLGAIDFQNSSFESPVIKANTWDEPPPEGFIWTGNHGFGLANGRTPWDSGAESGTQYAFMQSADNNGYTQGTCQQTVTGFIIGQTYEVTFYLATRPQTGGSPVSLAANGTQIFAPTMPPGRGSWTPFTSNTFKATTTSYTFVFSVAVPPVGTDQSSLLDNVHIVALAPPSRGGPAMAKRGGAGPK